MIYSMTGFGRGETRVDDGAITVEVTTLNSRYLEVQVRGLREQGDLELKVRERIANVLGRGKVSVQVVFSGVQTTEKTLSVDAKLAEQIVEEYDKLAHKFGLNTVIPPEALVSNGDIFTVSEVSNANDEIATLLLSALDSALEKVEAMRLAEGGRLTSDIGKRFDILGELVSEIADNSSDMVSDYRERLKKTVDELLPNDVDPGRLEQELVFFADRADITEELTRLNSHSKQVKATLNEGGRVGRRLDFIIQEINRELNTIGSKSCKSEISNAVVRGKDILEQIREQVQNIE
ncbi:MAG: YicC family protein [bacterium]|nr:YicC family protein [bacterium]